MSAPSSATPHVHVVGVAGVGMNPLAQILRQQGYRVTGSDRFLDQGRRLPILDQLEQAGIELAPQDGSALSPETEAVVISTAIEADNPERIRAVELDVPVVHRATMLARFANAARGIAIAGTAGKTTTTGMSAWLLTELGFNPSVCNGAGLVNWKGESNAPNETGRPGNTRKGGDGPAGPLWIYEADESDKSFLVFEPDWAVITNIAADHFDLPESIALFREFAARVKTGIACSPETAAMLSPLPERLQVVHPPRTPLPVSLLGAHNQENARHAFTLCEALGAEPKALLEALPRFRGIERRLEEHTPEQDSRLRIFDDYAHNPSKIAAAWRAVADATAGRVFGLWRPHGYGPLRQNLGAFADTFREARGPDDALLLLPVFYAGGTADRSLDSPALAERLERAEVLESYAAAEEAILAKARPGDAVVYMGARDPDLPVAARTLAARLKRPVIRGVLFDLDGLLLDTETTAHNAWRLVGQESGIEIPAGMLQDMTGKRLQDMVPIMQTWMPDIDDHEAFLAHCNTHYDRLLIEEPPAIKPGVVELLDLLEAKNIPAVVASSSQRYKIENKLRGAGLIERLPQHVSGHEVARGKPAPDIFLEAAAMLGLPPWDCVAFEDSPPGVRAAYDAGCVSVMVPDRIPHRPDIPAQHVMASLNDAIPLFA